MSKTQVEVVFGFIGEELAGAPIPCKPEKRSVNRIKTELRPYEWQIPDAYPSGFASASSARTYPIKRLQVMVRIDDDFERSASQRDVMSEVLKQAAYQLAVELVPLLEVERRPDDLTRSTQFCATLRVVDPSVKGDAITTPEVGAMRWTYSV